MSRRLSRPVEVQCDGGGVPLSIQAGGVPLPVLAVVDDWREWFGVLAGEPERDVWLVDTPKGVYELHCVPLPGCRWPGAGAGALAPGTGGGLAAPMSSSAPPFVHLNVHSAFSFLDGSSSVESLVLRAAERGQPALALTDFQSVTGVVSFARRCGQAGIKPIGGCEVAVQGLGRVTLLADGPTGWASLCRLLSAAALRDVRRKGPQKNKGPQVTWEDLEECHGGLVCLSGQPEDGRVPALLRLGRCAEAQEVARRCQGLFGRGNYFLEVTRARTPGGRSLCQSLRCLADALDAPAVANNGVRHATKAGVAAHEALCRVRLGLAPHEQHADLPFNGERYLKGSEEMAGLFADWPEAVRSAVLLADRLDPPLDPDARHLPVYPHLPPGTSPFSLLAEMTWCGAEKRYGPLFNDGVKTRLVHEIETIRDLGFCDYFLVCWDICREARRRGVRYALRGSGVGSAVAYCLRMSEHDPIARNVSFDRFLSKGRAKPPDIDIDFAHDERDGMMQYVRDTYGHDKVANVSNYVTYRGRSLLRDFGKALGFDTDDVERLRQLLGHSRGDDLAGDIARTPQLRALGIEPEQYADLFALCAQLSGLPRHLGTHSSGIVVSDVPLCGVAPVQWAAKGVTVVSLDKDDVEAGGIGLLKIDQLSLRALTAIEQAVGTITLREPAFDYEGRDREEPETLAMIRAAQTVTCFQLESPAQMALQWRLKADKFDDLVASVALIRPGPLLGKTVEPYVRRRHGWEAVTYPLPELEPVLRETYGRILFQDQAIAVVRVVGGFTPDEADVFQKAITHARSGEEMQRLGLLLWERVKAKGITKKAFSRLWKQIEGFSRYGFCHGHALAFADHAQGTAWLLRHHPADFLAAVLSCEPCGFWPVATVVAEAWRRGVTVLAPCLNRSLSQQWAVESAGEENNEEGEGAGTEAGGAIRCSLAYVRGVGASAPLIERERAERGPFPSLVDACRRLPFLSREQLEWLALSGALDGLNANRRQALWSLPSLHAGHGRAGPGASVGGQVAADLDVPPLLPAGLPDFTAGESFLRQWQAIGFSPEGHPMRFHRERLEADGVLPCASLQGARAGQPVALAGLVVRPHRPPTAGGTVFFTLEDETGLAHVTVSPAVYELTGPDIYGQSALIVRGRAEKRGEGVNLLAERTQEM